jgi:hypothetical protein
MGFFSRKASKEIGEAPPLEEYAAIEELPPPPVPVFTGDKLCSRNGCGRQDGVDCQYIDRRGYRCDTAWCPDHAGVVGDQPFCPRHAGIMAALTLASQKGHLPDLHNRAPSLAAWIGNDIDSRIRQILTQLVNESDGETLIVEPVGYVYGMTDKSHRWERSWKLANSTGVTVKVSVDVDESQDTVVRVRVGGRVVDQMVPPWIQHHMNGVMVPPEQEASERNEFYLHICDQVAAALVQYRQQSAAGQRPYIGPGDGGQQARYTPQ